MLQRCDQSSAWVSGSVVVAVTAGRLPSASVGQKTEIGQGLTVFIGSPESRCFKRHCVNGLRLLRSRYHKSDQQSVLAACPKQSVLARRPARFKLRRLDVLWI